MPTPAPQSHTPDGNHPLVIGQKKNLGPLSAAGKEVWHGNATPCVTCGQLIPRSGGRCDRCGQDHDAHLLEKMARHSGPWFVYDHVRPFPGVSAERIRKLAERQALTRTSIVRGPTTYYQWRFAGETPFIAPLLGLCWKCQNSVTPEGRECPGCGALLDGRSAGEETEPAPQTVDPLDAELQTIADLAAASQRSELVQDRESQLPLDRLSLLFFLVALVTVMTIVIIAKETSPQSLAASDQSLVYVWDPCRLHHPILGA